MVEEGRAKLFQYKQAPKAMTLQVIAVMLPLSHGGKYEISGE